jgi:Haemophore, haem-binding
VRGYYLAHPNEFLDLQNIARPLTDLRNQCNMSVFQRWLADDGPEPAADDAARIRAVGQVVNQLRHSFTGPGVLAWFYRQHPVLGQPPVELLDDSLRYPQLLGAATAARAMTA